MCKEHLKQYWEIILFLIILLSYPTMIYAFKLYILGLQNIITLFAVIVAASASVLSLLNSRRTLNLSKELNVRTLEASAQLNIETLKQSEKNLKIQLLHEDRKNVLLDLIKILESPDGKNKTLEKFLSSPKSVFIPNSTRRLIETEIREVNQFEYENDPSIAPEPTPEQWEKIERENYELKQEIERSKNSYENYVDEYIGKFQASKRAIKNKVLENLKNPDSD
ncbi:MAG: hypothetical protein ACLQG5_06215 [Methanobacterium sp.]|jgi:hypothetical protein